MGNRHLVISIKSWRSCIILDDLEISVNPCKSETNSKHQGYCLDHFGYGLMNLGIFVHFGISSFGVLVDLGKSNFEIFEILNNYCTSWKINILESQPSLNIPTPTLAPDHPGEYSQVMSITRCYLES